jgi:hypothetical protein
VQKRMARHIWLVILRAADWAKMDQLSQQKSGRDSQVIDLCRLCPDQWRNDFAQPAPPLGGSSDCA